MAVPPPKTCAVCGRTFTWRKKWARDWPSVRYCSADCRRTGVDPDDEALEDVILEALRARRRGATLCPSEAARAHFGEERWRGQMERTRRAARRLAARGALVITQRSRIVDPDTARGPIRLRLP